MATSCLVWCGVHNSKDGRRLQLSNCFLRSGKFKRPFSVWHSDGQAFNFVGQLSFVFGWFTFIALMFPASLFSFCVWDAGQVVTWSENIACWRSQRKTEIKNNRAYRRCLANWSPISHAHEKATTKQSRIAWTIFPHGIKEYLTRNVFKLILALRYV